MACGRMDNRHNDSHPRLSLWIYMAGWYLCIKQLLPHVYGGM